MAYQLGPNGLPMVGGLQLPLTPEQMAAAGVNPEQAPGGIPMPPMQNPYGGLPPNAVAGPGGGPTDLGSAAPDSAIRLAAGNGAGPQLSPGDLARLTAPPPTSRAHETQSRADSLLNIGAGDHAAASRPPALISTVGEAQQAANAPAPSDPGQDAAAAWAMRHAMGGGGPRQLLETGETQKYKQYGTVPEALTQDIDARQQALDKAQAAGFSQVATDNADALARQRDIIAQQQADAQQAEARRQQVNQRIAQLQAHSDAAESALTQATPKQASEYFGGNAGASILAGLAIALGAGVQTRTGHNPGAEIVNGAIDRWVNDQKQQYEAAKDKATLANNAYKNALDVFGTPEAAQSQITLQALAAKNAMAQNMADQSKNQQWLANANLMQQDDQLKRQQLRAQGIQQAGMRDVDSTLRVTGGPGGSGKNPFLEGAKAAAEYRTATRTASDSTNEDVRTGLEVKKAEGAGAAGANAANDAAEAVGALQEQTKNVGGRIGAGAGDTTALLNNAESKFAAHLAKSGVPPRAALQQAKEAFSGVADKIRTTGHADAQLARVKAIIEGDARRASVRKNANVALGSDGGAEVGEPE